MIKKDHDSLYPVGTIIFSMIKANSKVLDVGCGGKDEKLKTGKNCLVAGIKIDIERAALAEKRLNKIIVADVEKLHELPCRKRPYTQRS